MNYRRKEFEDQLLALSMREIIEMVLELQTENDDLKERNQKVEEVRDSLTAENEELSKQLDELTVENATLKTELKTLRSIPILHYPHPDRE